MHKPGTLLLLAICGYCTNGCLIPPPGGSPAVTKHLSNKVPAPPPIPAEGGGAFELAWQDDFNKLDLSRWKLMTHSFPSNLATFSAANTRIVNGILYLDLKRAPNDHDKPFRGVEMRSIEALTYGKVEARARFARGSGVVSSLVTFYTPWPADDWNELDGQGDRAPEAAAEHLADDLGIVRGRLGRRGQRDDRTGKRRLRLGPGVPLALNALRAGPRQPVVRRDFAFCRDCERRSYVVAPWTAS